MHVNAQAYKLVLGSASDFSPPYIARKYNAILGSTVVMTAQ